jgi:predicted acyltransferase (DUF342 family)
MLLFTAAMLLRLALHFAFAMREWRRTKGAMASEIDFHYERTEDYLGTSFRRKVEEWMARASEDGSAPHSTRGESLAVADSLDAPDHAALGDLLLVKGDFSCGTHATLSKELYVQGNCRIGASSIARALAVDGDLALGPDSQVQRWVDCHGSIDIGPGCKLGGRTHSAAAIRFHAGAQAVSLHAVEVLSMPAAAPAPAAPAVVDAFVLDPDTVLLPEELERAGIDAKRLRRASADTWAYAGDFHPAVPLRCSAKMFVRGACRLPAGSVTADLKATGRLEIGERCRCEGALVSSSDILIGSDTALTAPVFADGTVRLARRVHGGESAKPVSVYGRDGVVLDPGVTIHGKVASPGGVTSAATRS